MESNGLFRTKMFGGFNKKDVFSYVNSVKKRTTDEIEDYKVKVTELACAANDLGAKLRETEKALEEELSKTLNVNCEAELVWTTEPESIGKNTTIEVIKITQIRIKMMEHLEEEVIREMWEYLTKNYCSEVLIE